MSDNRYGIGDSFSLQFVWHVPEGDYVRAVFQARVIFIDYELEKYLVRLEKLVAGRQESEDGDMRDVGELTDAYWGLVGRLPGKRVSVAWEVDDGRALHMKFATLTGEHPFFSRFDMLPD